MMPVGALGAGGASRTATGCGAGGGTRSTFFTTLGFTGGGGSGRGGGGAGSTFGCGGVTSSVSISTGTTTSTLRLNNPLCRAHNAAAWNSTTLPPMTMLRLSGRTEEQARADKRIV